MLPLVIAWATLAAAAIPITFWRFRSTFDRVLSFLPINRLGLIISSYAPKLWLWSWDFNHQYLLPNTGRDACEPIPGLTSSAHPSTFPLPTSAALSSPSSSFSTSSGSISKRHTPLFVKLHVFSMATPTCASRRALIRSQNWLAGLPSTWRHRVEIKFILGRPWAGESSPFGKHKEDVDKEGIMSEIKREQAEFGDVVCLDMDENMNQGKTTAWMRQIGRSRLGEDGEGDGKEEEDEEGRREALWVFKVDDDSIVIIQNLLDILVHLDPTVPTYVGDLRRHWQYTHSYMTGGFYGLSWGIVKTIAEADMSEWDITYNRPEDARTGSLVHLLPSLPAPADMALNTTPFPLSKSYPLVPRVLSAFNITWQTLSPVPVLALFVPSLRTCGPRALYPGGPILAVQDHRTGVQRVLLSGFFGDWSKDPLYPFEKVVAVHMLKEDQVFKDVWGKAQRALKQAGREEWAVPIVLKGKEGWE